MGSGGQRIFPTGLSAGAVRSHDLGGAAAHKRGIRVVLPEQMRCTPSQQAAIRAAVPVVQAHGRQLQPRFDVGLFAPESYGMDRGELR